MSDEVLNNMIIRQAVLEQLTLNLLIMVSQEYDDETGFRAALFENVQSSFRASAQEATAPGQKAFAQRSLKFANELEDRVSRMAGDSVEH